MLVPTFLLSALLYLPSIVTAVPIIHTTSLNCRSSPSTSSKIVRTYKTSDNLSISCQIKGPSIKGNNLWDKTQHGCYVSDYYVKTGTNGLVKPLCNKPSGKPKPTPKKIPGPRKNDYRYRSRCNGGQSVDAWNYFTCNCTSFVAQRINERWGIKFHNRYRGKAWGHANQWDEAARKSGVKINKTPKPGAIAQHNKGKRGHVAWVSDVLKDGRVVIEEYNWGKRLGYTVRTVKKGEFDYYIHMRG